MNIKEYWIATIQNLLEFQALGDTENVEILLLQDEIAQVLNNQFITTATEFGVARRELMLKIQPFTDDTLDNRKFRILAKWLNQIPYTYRRLEEKLNEVVGLNGYTIVLDSGAYTLVIAINLGNKRMFADAKEVIRLMVPANLAITVTLRYNRHIDLMIKTHTQLSVLTHTQIREEVL